MTHILQYVEVELGNQVVLQLFIKDIVTQAAMGRRNYTGTLSCVCLLGGYNNRRSVLLL